MERYLEFMGIQINGCKDEMEKNIMAKGFSQRVSMIDEQNLFEKKMEGIGTVLVKCITSKMSNDVYGISMTLTDMNRNIEHLPKMILNILQETYPSAIVKHKRSTNFELSLPYGTITYEQNCDTIARIIFIDKANKEKADNSLLEFQEKVKQNLKQFFA